MSNQPVSVPGIVLPVSISSNFWTGKHTVMVGDRPAAATGKRTYALPTVDGGTVEGKVSRSTLINPFPTLEVAGVKHPTGPALPGALRILMVAPLLLVVLGGLVGGVVAIIAILINANLARGTRSTAGKAGLMTLTLAAAIAIWVAVAAMVIQ